MDEVTVKRERKRASTVGGWWWRGLTGGKSHPFDVVTTFNVRQ